MLFLFVTALLGWMSLAGVWMSLAGERPRTNASRAASVGMLVAAMLASMPVLLEFAEVGRGLEQGGKRSLSFSTSASTDLWLLAIGGTLALLVSGLRLAGKRRADTVGFFSIGKDVLGFLIGAYLVLVVADQCVWFGVPQRADTGVLNWAAAKSFDPAGLSDVQCDQDAMIVKGIDGDVATYRCPAMPQVVLARNSSAPIFTWPSYTEGRSKSLAALVKRLQSGEPMWPQQHSDQPRTAGQ